jgi:hypothetical protein
VRLLIVLGIAAAALPARADEYNYQNLLVGTRSSGMGGADVAFADSVTGAYYNPAGIVDAEARLISVDLKAYRVDLAGFSDISASEGKSGRAAGFQFNSFPLNFGLVTKLGTAWGLTDHTLAFNFFVEDNDVGGARVDVRIPGAVDLYLRVRRKDRETLRFGPAWAARRGNFSFGASVAYQLRVESVLVDSLVDIQDNVTYRLLDTQAVHGAVVGQAGVLWRPWRGLRIGATLLAPGVRIHGTAVGSQLELRSGVMPSFAPSSEQPMEYRTPWRGALGLGYQWKNGVRAAIDAAVYSGIDRYEVIPGLVQAEGQWTLTFNAGVEVPAGKKLVLRAGAFTNPSASPDPPMKMSDTFDDPTRLPHVDYYGGTLGATIRAGQSSLDLSVVYQYGTGWLPAETSRGFDPVEPQIVVVMLGGTYAFLEGGK